MTPSPRELLVAPMLPPGAQMGLRERAQRELELEPKPLASIESGNPARPENWPAADERTGFLAWRQKQRIFSRRH